MRALLAAVLLPFAVMAQAPSKLGYQGLLLKSDGNPETGMAAIQFAIYAEATGGSPLWQETQQLGLSQGFYSTFLGEVTPVPEGVFDGTTRYLELAVKGQTLSPRQALNSVPYAMVAGNARNVTGGTVSASSLKVNGVEVIDATGRLTGPASYTPGNGLALNGNAFSIDTSAIQSRVIGTCAPGSSIRSIDANGAVVCDTNGGSAYSASPDGGLVLNGSSFALDSSGCTAPGQVLKWTGSGWACLNEPNGILGHGAVTSRTVLVNTSSYQWINGVTNVSSTVGETVLVMGTIMIIPASCATPPCNSVDVTFGPCRRVTGMTNITIGASNRNVAGSGSGVLIGGLAAMGEFTTAVTGNYDFGICASKPNLAGLWDVNVTASANTLRYR